MARAWSTRPDRQTPSRTADAGHPWQVMAPSAALGPLASCRTPANPAVGAAANPAWASQATPLSSQSLLATEGYALPAQVDPTDRHLFCLHEKTVEDQGFPAVRSEFEDHRSKAMLETPGGYGFVVISELRNRDADPEVFAARPAGQIEDLLTAGVPSGSITVVGASMGPGLAALASCRLADSGLRKVHPSSCHPDLPQEWATRGITLNRPTNTKGMA